MRSERCNVTLAEQSSKAPCILGRSFGCTNAESSPSVWVRGCRGRFLLRGCSGKDETSVSCGWPPGASSYHCTCDGRSTASWPRAPQLHGHAHRRNMTFAPEYGVRQRRQPLIWVINSSLACTNFRRDKDLFEEKLPALFASGFLRAPSPETADVLYHPACLTDAYFRLRKTPKAASRLHDVESTVLRELKALSLPGTPVVLNALRCYTRQPSVNADIDAEHVFPRLWRSHRYLRFCMEAFPDWDADSSLYVPYCPPQPWGSPLTHNHPRPISVLFYGSPDQGHGVRQRFVRAMLRTNGSQLLRVTDKAPMRSDDDRFGPMARASYTLCPPGDTPESQRIYHAISQGSVPLLDDSFQRPSIVNWSTLSAPLRINEAGELELPTGTRARELQRGVWRERQTISCEASNPHFRRYVGNGLRRMLWGAPAAAHGPDPAANLHRHAHRSCGFHSDCALDYNVKDVNLSADAWDPHDKQQQRAARERHAEASRSCDAHHVAAGSRVAIQTSSLTTGGYCLPPAHKLCDDDAWLPPSKGRRCTALVRLPRNQSYGCPPGHVPADAYVLDALAVVLKPPAPSAVSLSSMYPSLSLLDLGAGVGQVGHALLSRGDFNYRGCDGAGNVVEATNAFLSFCDLTTPISLPRAHWVLSLECGEHIAHSSEAMFVRNLHAHNLCGIILSWAALDQPGLNHINNHGNDYLLRLFSSLGYAKDEVLTRWLREGGAPNAVPGKTAGWLRRTLLALRRLQPSEECGVAVGA